jgi:hypothetical protein
MYIDIGDLLVCMSSKRTTKPFFKMTLAEREAFIHELESGIPASRLKPLSEHDRALWRAAKRGPGRPRKAPGAKSVPIRVTFEPALLKEIDAYAHSNGMTRAELLARGAKLAMAKRGSSR